MSLWKSIVFESDELNVDISRDQVRLVLWGGDEIFLSAEQVSMIYHKQKYLIAERSGGYDE